MDSTKAVVILQKYSRKFIYKNYINDIKSQKK